MTPPINEMGTSQLKQEALRLRLENAGLLAALERAESDLDVALERVRAAIARAAPKVEADDDDDLVVREWGAPYEFDLPLTGMAAEHNALVREFIALRRTNDALVAELAELQRRLAGLISSGP